MSSTHRVIETAPPALAAEAEQAPRPALRSPGEIALPASGVHQWAAPAWAVICGLVASESFVWGSGATWLRLAQLLLLIEIGWVILWWSLGTTDWAASIARWRDWSSVEHVAPLPYTQPGTPGSKVTVWVGEARAWLAQSLWLSHGSAIRLAMVGLAATVVLALALGPESSLLSVAAVATMLLGLAWVRGSGELSPGWDAVLCVLLPWLAGHAAFGPLSLASLGAAACIALAYAALWRLQQLASRALLVVANIALAGLLLWRSQPLAAVSVLVLLTSQIVPLPWLEPTESHPWYLRHSRIWLAVAAFISAWAL